MIRGEGNREMLYTHPCLGQKKRLKRKKEKCSCAITGSGKTVLEWGEICGKSRTEGFPKEERSHERVRKN